MDVSKAILVATCEVELKFSSDMGNSAAGSE